MSTWEEMGGASNAWQGQTAPINIYFLLSKDWMLDINIHKAKVLKINESTTLNVPTLEDLSRRKCQGYVELSPHSQELTGRDVELLYRRSLQSSSETGRCSPSTQIQNFPGPVMAGSYISSSP